MKKKIGDRPTPLFKEVRELILRKCTPGKEKQPFGELERLVTQKILDVAKREAKKEVESEDWLREVARISNCSYERVQVSILDFLDNDIFHLSIENGVLFLEPLVGSWDLISNHLVWKLP